MTPTIVEVKRVADTVAAEEIEVTDGNFEYPESTYFVRSFTYEQLQAFAQHYIEVGRKQQRIEVARIIRNNTGE